MMSKVQYLFCSENCTTEGRGGEREGVDISKNSLEFLAPRTRLGLPFPLLNMVGHNTYSRYWIKIFHTVNLSSSKIGNQNGLRTLINPALINANNALVA